MSDTVDRDEIPELGEEFFARATLKISGKPVRHAGGRPAPNGAKQQLTLRLDPAVVEGFRATGPGWQGRMNEALNDWLAKTET